MVARFRFAFALAALSPAAHAAAATDTPALPSNLAETATPGVDPKAPCSGAAYRQLDLWLGDWQVYDAKSGKQVGVDHVTADYSHCVIRQEMRFVGGMYRHPGTPFALAGTSISRFDGQQWLQLWADNQWGAIVLKGGQRPDGAFELNSLLPSRGRDMRLVWVQAADGLHIEQYGARAGTGAYERYPDLLYRRAPKSSSKK